MKKKWERAQSYEKKTASEFEEELFSSALHDLLYLYFDAIYDDTNWANTVGLLYQNSSLYRAKAI